MNFRRDIEQAAAAFPSVVSPSSVEPACSAGAISPAEYCDDFAREVARLFLCGELAWVDGDAAMNALSGYFFVHLPAEAPFPDYAFGVFLAFDAGELLPEPENEAITRGQLEALHAKP